MQIIHKSPNPIQDLTYLDMVNANNVLIPHLNEIANEIINFSTNKLYGSISINFLAGKPQIIETKLQNKLYEE